MNGASAGRVLLIFKGDYESATTYKPMDVVIYGVNSYVCLLESTGNVPTNTTYWQTLAKGISNMSPEAIGIGYGLSQNTGASKTATLADYTLTINGIVAVTFAEDVPANATLNINSQGAKPIYYRGSAIVANVIRGGDTVTFAYDGTHYDILCIDGGAGHEIENSAGTKLTQRDVMQVTDGLEAVDDSTNQKTKIKMNLPIVPFEDWNAMTEQEQETYKASHYRFGVGIPDTSGVINAEYMKLLWENPNTSQAFAPQTITLNSADYDSLLVYFITNPTWSVSLYDSCSIPKGQSGILNVGRVNYSREVIRVSDTSYSIGAGTDGSTSNSNYCIPVAVYGIKKDFQFKVNAIADTLSTRADHCFLSDNVTTVEDKLNEGFIYSTEERYGGKWIDGSDWYYKTVYCGAMPNTTTKNVAHGISNLSLVFDMKGFCYFGVAYVPIPRPVTAGNSTIDILVSGSNIVITTVDNYSAYIGYVTLRYTKTS